MGTFNRRSFISKSASSIGSIVIGSAAFSGFLQSSCVNRNKNSVPTLKGSIDCNKLGTTLMHEHILLGQIPEKLQKTTIDIAVKMLNEAANAGVTTLVDVMPFDSYCNSASGIASISSEYEIKLELYKAIAAQTPVNIIVSTGFYRYDKAPEELKSMTEAQMESRIYNAVTEGVGNSKIRAGIIKLAADESTLTEWEKKAFRAAARVQKATGVPIATHACTGAREQFDLLVSSGADPNHLNFAHIETESGWKKGISREQFAADFLSIVKEGGYLLFNNFSCEFYTPWADMVYLLRYYCDQGFAHRILISEDCNWEWKNNSQVFEGSEEHPEASARTYAYFLSHEVPMMLKSGFTKEEIETFLVHNPCNFFSWLS
jgi:phosphotriesterase-related protein